ncbi:hypothetical protein B0T18DRAFT_122515 [Schizothecium vesticola]|uniref:Uncharacterized protein n=1 Tax=Schizothecium vesticola TaxID=314040 RepID=A0AA40F397_9PEZI|nr:hypothetical protein B0T18DRAFT_122515 [Schizothecium vesticola]
MHGGCGIRDTQPFPHHPRASAVPSLAGTASLQRSRPPRCIDVGDDIEQWREVGNDGGTISTPAPFPRQLWTVDYGGKSVATLRLVDISPQLLHLWQSSPIEFWFYDAPTISDFELHGFTRLWMVTVPRTHAVSDDPILGVQTHGVGGHRWGIADQPLSTRGHGRRLLLPCVPGPSRGIHHMYAAPRVWDGPRATDWGYLRGGLTWLRHLHTALSPYDARCSAYATRKPTVIVGYNRESEDGIRCRALGCSNPGIAQRLHNGRRQRAEG